MRNHSPKYNRQSIRLKGYDYSQRGLYFMTLCVQNRQHLFGEIKNGIMCLNPLGSIAYQEWEQTPLIRKNISLGAFIIMPNHMHGILQIDYSLRKEGSKIGAFGSPSQTVGAIIRGYKGAATKKIKNHLRNSDELQSAHLRTGKLQFTSTEGFAPTAGLNKLNIDFSKSIWQRNYYEHIIRDHQAFSNISYYIENNPQKWSKDKFK